MVLNNVTKFHRIKIKTIHLREQTSVQPTFFHKLRAITPLMFFIYIFTAFLTRTFKALSKFKKECSKRVICKNLTELWPFFDFDFG